MTIYLRFYIRNAFYTVFYLFIRTQQHTYFVYLFIRFYTYIKPTTKEKRHGWINTIRWIVDRRFATGSDSIHPVFRRETSNDCRAFADHRAVR